jgi:hypothetical protein
MSASIDLLRGSISIACAGLVGLTGLVGCNALTGADDLVVDEAGPQTSRASGATTGGAGGTAGAGGGGTTVASSTAATTGAGGTSGATTTAASSSSSTSGGGGDPLEMAAQLCVDTINMYRATMGLTPYARWTDGETCGGQEAQKDSQTMTAHSAFGTCGEWAQNECPGWPGPAGGMIAGCLQMMWNEGPGDFYGGHGHYINMSSTQYTKVSCGFYTLADGSVWATQDFQ